MMLPRAMVISSKSSEQLTPLIAKPATKEIRPRNTQLFSPISPSIHPSPISPPFMPTYSPQKSDHSTAGPQSNLVPIKGFTHEVFRRSCTSGNVLPTALCYLEAIHAKIPELVEKEKRGVRIQGEPDLSEKIVQGDLEAVKCQVSLMLHHLPISSCHLALQTKHRPWLLAQCY